MRRSLYCIFVLMGCLALACISFQAISKFDRARNNALARTNQDSAALYLPNGKGLEFISFGYHRVLSHILWFNTISYFAKQYRGSKDYRWLSHMCELVTRLNPQAMEAFRFCAMMLAWEGNLPQQSLKMLNQAIRAHPRDWLFFYLRGFVRVFFLNDEDGAARDFKRASELPDVHPLIVKLTGKKLMNMAGPEAAIEFLEEALKSSQDPYSQRVIAERLREARFELGFRLIEQAVDRYAENFGQAPSSIEQLAGAGLITESWSKSGFKDEFGGHYYLRSSKENARAVEVLSSSRERPRKAAWKRAPQAKAD